MEPLCLFYEAKAPGLSSAAGISELPLYPPATAHAELQQLLTGKIQPEMLLDTQG